MPDGNKKKTEYQQSYKTEFTEAVCQREDITCGTVNSQQSLSIQFLYIFFKVFFHMSKKYMSAWIIVNQVQLS